jgi:hypothetical protein
LRLQAVKYGRCRDFCSAQKRSIASCMADLWWTPACCRWQMRVCQTWTAGGCGCCCPAAHTSQPKRTQ